MADEALAAARGLAYRATNETSSRELGGSALGAQARRAVTWSASARPRDVLDLARKGRAFATLDSLIRRQGSPAVQSGDALVLAATMRAWSDLTGERVDQITRTVFTTQ